MPIQSSALQGFEYDTVQQIYRLGATSWTIESLRNFEDTVDQIFEALKKNGDPSWLEELCPYFAQVWPSGVALSEVISEMDETLWKNKSVLELGGGLALPSLYLAKLGAEVTITDAHPDVPVFLKRNLALNQIQSGVTYQELQWEKSLARQGDFDWVIGSDILYDRSHPDSLCEALFRQLGAGTKVLIADPGRPYLQPFVDGVKKRLGRDPGLQAHRLKTGKEIFLIEFESGV